MTERLLGLSDVARERGVSIQVVANWYSRANGKLPKPSYMGPRDAPLWRRSTLERAGVVPSSESEKISQVREVDTPSQVSVGGAK